MRHILLGSIVGTAMFLTGCETSIKPISEIEAQDFANSSKAEIERRQQPVTKAISISEAMARALKNNLDHRVAMLEADLAQADYDLSKWDMLPKVVANGQYFGRSNDAGASSLSLLSGRQSLEPSTSTERDVFTADLTASWNILDFGLSKIRAEQLGNEALVYEERRRKAIIKIVEEVQRAYFRAISAEQLSTHLGALESEVNSAFETSRQQFASRKTAPMPALSYQRELNDIQGQAQSMAKEMQVAKMELAALMGLSPNQDYTLEVPGRMPHPTKISMSFDEMIEVALKNRPEIRENLYMQRIGEKEIKKATLEALPSLEGFAGVDWSSNDFLFNNDWAGYGARTSWNLLKVFSTGKRRRKAKAQHMLEKERGLATAMAVMTQVGVARAHYESLSKEYKTVENGAMVQSDILGQVEALARASSASKQTLVRERMNSIVSEARRGAIIAEIAEAEAKIYTALGYDPYAARIDGTEDLQTIADNIGVSWRYRSNPTIQ